jgi:hypothetical protein
MKLEFSETTRFYRFPNIQIFNILPIVRSWIGTRFLYHGRIKINDKNLGGVDCLGLILGVADEIGAIYNGKPLSFYDNLSYKKIPQKNQLKNAMDKYFIAVHANNRQIGDIALFEINKEICHLGILSDIGLIHCYLQAKKVVEHGLASCLG